MEIGGTRLRESWPSAPGAVHSTLLSLADWYENAAKAYQLIWTALGRVAEELHEQQAAITSLQLDAYELNRTRLRLIEWTVEAGGSDSAVPLPVRPAVAAWLAERSRVVGEFQRTWRAAEESALRTAEDLTLARGMTQHWREQLLQYQHDQEAGRDPGLDPLWGLVAPVAVRSVSLTAAVPTATVASGAAAAPVLAMLLPLAGIVGVTLLIGSHRRQPQPGTNTTDRALAVSQALRDEPADVVVNSDGQNVFTEPEPEPEPAAAGAGSARFPRDPCGPDTPGFLRNMIRGNGFNHVNRDVYTHNEVVLANGRRVDSYQTRDTTGNVLFGSEREVVSRKYSQLAGQPYGAMEALREFETKYASGTPLSTGSAMRTEVPRLEGHQVLEVPPQREGVPQRVLDEAAERDIIIRDTNGLVYDSRDIVSDEPDPMKGYCE